VSDWYAQGAPLDAIPVDDRAAQYGDGLFETVAIRHGEPRFWSSHCERLTIGCDRMGLPALDSDLLLSQLRSAIEQSEVDSRFATAKIVVAAAVGQRGYQRTTEDRSSIRIGLFDSKQLAAEAYQAGIAARVCQTRLAIQPALAGIKSLNRLEQVLARAEWDDPSVFEGLMLDTDDRLICGTMSNVFLCSGNSIVTPAITRCGIAGVMRRQVLAELEKAGRTVDVRDVEIAELMNADEVFISNSQFGIVPVDRVNAARFAQRDVSREVMGLLSSIGVEECSI